MPSELVPPGLVPGRGPGLCPGAGSGRKAHGAEAGHDDNGESVHQVLQSKSVPRTVLRSRGEGEQRLASRASLALDNLRAFVILLVLSFHSVLAYLNFLPASPFPFDSPPYLWRAFPIVDTARWFGFDLFCAWQDVFLMSLFFFLSGLFVWRSLERKRTRTFLYDRIVRLGVPFAFVVALLMPLANYPTYLQTAADPSFIAFSRDWLALPFWPCGPMWFLWLLLVADFAAAALHRFAPEWGDALIRFSSFAGARPMRYFAAFVMASALAYVPLAVAFTPSVWVAIGPFGFQLSRPLHYAVYFFAGMGLGACGIERGLFAPDGVLVQGWVIWPIAALGSLLLWMALTALAMGDAGSPSLGLQILDDLSFVLACFGNCFAVLALVLRFAGKRLPVLDALKRDAYGMYLVHYGFVVWLQYALLGAALFAVVKGAIVFAGTLLLSWGIIVAVRRIPPAAQVIGVDRPKGAPHGAAA